jgi:hypothetical protein
MYRSYRVAVATLVSLACLASCSPSRPVDVAGATPASQSRSSDSALGTVYAEPHVHPDFRPGLLPFTLHFDGVDSPYETMSAFVMPGQAFEFSASGGTGAFSATADAGTLKQAGDGAWQWTAPRAHGNHEIRVHDNQGGDTAVLQVFVLHPYDGGTAIGNFRVGRYQKKPLGDDPAYTRPSGFVEVTRDNLGTMLSPHFRLSQFTCKGSKQFPMYVALRSALLVKLEGLMELLARRGLPAESLHVLSGYRTPAYNRGIGNETTYSRHTYGDAADVVLDRDGDGVQDDLNGDGLSNREDAELLVRLVEDTLDASLPAQMAGGLSAYGATAKHGPFLHIDTRGHRVRW